ncbi:MAG: type II toxin-antitoxin system VapC family toxin [Dehalococcoidia bacterium]
MKYLVDSDWIIDCLRGDQKAAAVLLGVVREGLAVSIISVAEIYEGAYGLPDSAAHMQTLRSFLRAFTPLTVSDSIAERFAQLRAKLRQEGRPIADFDLLIAATALEHGLALITRNERHFRRIEGLELYSG